MGARAAAIGLGLAMSLLAGAAQAEAPSQALAQAVRPDLARTPAVKLSLDPKTAEAHALKRAGIARTAIDRRLSGDDVTGYLGFLCGIQPGADRNGAAAARGVDPSGRFVGAKLSLAFR
jgi:hypothetical protein